MACKMIFEANVTNMINFTTKYSLIIKGLILMNWFIINQRHSPVI